MKRNGAARAIQISADDSVPKSFNFRPRDEGLNERVREYLIRNNISFNDLCHEMIPEWLDDHRTWPKKKTLRLPRGPRPRV